MLLRPQPVFARPVWAGSALSERYGKPNDLPRVGESWEVWRDNRLGDGRVLGEVVAFPLLIKLLSTRDVLSVQVHPDDATAIRFGAPSGKVEAWAILEAEPGAKVALGLKRDLPPEVVKALAQDGGIEGELSWFPVRPGDVVDVPAGTIHAIGGGVTLYEIQQPADITWRLYDWGRGRELHLDAAMTVARCGPAAPPAPRDRLDSPHFSMCGARAGALSLAEPRALTVTRGSLEVRIGTDAAALTQGETVLVGPGPVVLAGAGEGIWGWPR